MSMTELTRRRFLSLGIGVFAVASLPVALWRRRRLTRRSLPIMGTVADIVVLHGSVALAREGIDAAMLELRRIERLMTRFTRTSDVGRLNDAPVNRAIPVTADTAFVVAEALRWAHASGGAFDPGIGAAVRLWDVTHRETPPSQRDVASLAHRGFYRAIEVGTSRGRPVLLRHDADAQIDLGGIAKGYGIDRAVAVLRDHGITDAVVDVGGDLIAIGDGPAGDGWNVGIRSPHSPDDVARVFSVRDAAVATSGTYAQYFTHQGVRYHHLLDPTVAAPRRTIVQSFSVQAPTCLQADAAATACYGMTANDTSRLLALAGPGSRVLGVL